MRPLSGCLPPSRPCSHNAQANAMRASNTGNAQLCDDRARRFRPRIREETMTSVTGTRYDARWARARERLAAARFDGLYVNAGPTFAWLSGYAPYPGGW